MDKTKMVLRKERIYTMKCINCAYFLNCDIAEENKVECNKYKKRSYETKLVKVEGMNYKFERIGK